MPGTFFCTTLLQKNVPPTCKKLWDRYKGYYYINCLHKFYQIKPSGSYRYPVRITENFSKTGDKMIRRKGQWTTARKKQKPA